MTGLPGGRADYPVPEAVTRGDFAGTFERHLKSSKYQVINVEVSGRTIHEATDVYVDATTYARALDFLRDLWLVVHAFRV